MILKQATQKAINIACTQYHYAKLPPRAMTIGFSVFNDNNEFCGVILFGNGANSNMGSSFGLRIGQIMELTRVALNGKQESTSKAVSIAMKLIKKQFPLLKMLVSYADIDQNHKGIIYQATNWQYLGQTSKNAIFYIDKTGLKRHPRLIHLHMQRKGLSRPDAIKDLGYSPIKTTGKRKYVYIFDKTDKIMIEYVRSMAKPYPKEDTE